MADLYATANLARLRACVRVALKMRASFSRRLGGVVSADAAVLEDGIDVRAGAEKEDHAGRRVSRRDVDGGLLPEVKALHEGVGEADFGSVDGTIAGCFDEGKVVCILGIEDDLIDGILLSVRTGESC